MSRTYAFTEPHPSVPRSGGYIGGGRGGAGNFHRYQATDLTSGPNATGPASRVHLSKPFKRIVAAGRGGAGNMFNEADESIFQFDEELVKRREHEAPVYHIGRGGAANYVAPAAKTASSSGRKESSASSASQTSTRSSTAVRNAERMFGLFGRRNS